MRTSKKARPDACDWVGQLKDAEAHFKVCEYAGVRCPYQGCGALVARRDLPDHQRTCEYGMRPCRWAGCGKTFTGAALAAHESTCGKRVVFCLNDGCIEGVAFDALVAHRRTCHYETVPCSYAGVGCTVRMPRKDVDAHEEAAMKQHNQLLIAKVCGLQQEVNTLKEEGGRRGKEVLVVRVKHAELTGAEPFVPQRPSRPTKVFSENVMVDGRTFSLMVETDDAGVPDHYGVFLSFDKGPLPCKVKYALELVAAGGLAAIAYVKSQEQTYETHIGWGYKDFVTKALLANAANNAYVKNGYVTFKCTFEVVE